MIAGEERGLFLVTRQQEVGGQDSTADHNFPFARRSAQMWTSMFSKPPFRSNIPVYLRMRRQILATCALAAQPKAGESSIEGHVLCLGGLPHQKQPSQPSHTIYRGH